MPASAAWPLWGEVFQQVFIQAHGLEPRAMEGREKMRTLPCSIFSSRGSEDVQNSAPLEKQAVRPGHRRLWGAWGARRAQALCDA